jgi:RHS repeat-associated protein
VRDSRKPDTWHYTWSADDKLTVVTTPDGARWRYRYDPLGRRIAKQRLDLDGRVTEQTDFAWDGITLAEQATADDGSVTGGGVTGGGAPGSQRVITWDYRPGTFTPLAQAERTTGRQAPQDQVDSRFYAIVTDLIGSPSELVAADGSLAGYQQHTLWGATLWHPEGASTPLRFPGQYQDDETGLHYNNHRYYDPAAGRYLTPDPLGLAPAPNPHTYVPNPLVLADPFGLNPGDTSGGDGWTTVYRFHTAADPNTLLPNMYSSDLLTQAKIMENLQDPGMLRFMADSHMGGSTVDSPFISVTTDPALAAQSSDGWLRTIATGQPGTAGAKLAPDLSEFRVPVTRLIEPAPTNTLSISEGERLWLGPDLNQYLVRTIPNPFALPPPP